MFKTIASRIKSLVRAPSRWLGRLSISLALLAAANGALAAGGEAVKIRKSYSGNIDYVAVGASFRNTTNNCDFFNPMSTTVNVNIPVGAEVIQAFLYYSGSADIGPNYHTEEIDLSDQTALTLNGFSIPTTPGINDRNFPNLTGLGGGVEIGGRR